MRKGVIICGANGERGFLLEKAIEIFAPRNSRKIIQFSVNTVALSPNVIRLSGIDEKSIITVNGCRNRCVDRILEKSGIGVNDSFVLDEVIDRKIAPCQSVSCSEYRNFKLENEEIQKIAGLIEQMINR